MTRLPDRKEPGKWRALLFSIAVHAGLLGILIFGIHWKNREPETVEVELWSAAAPPAVRHEPRPEPLPEPKPDPKPEPKPVVEEPPKVKPEIEEKAEKKPEKKPAKKPEPKPKPEVKPEPKPKPQEHKPDFRDLIAREQEQLARQQEAEREARIRDQAGKEAASAARLRGLADYQAKIKGKVRGNIVLPLNIQGNPEAVFEIVQLPTGEVVSVKLTRSSGNSSLDAAIERAILKSSPLPKPDDPELFSRIINLHYRPIDE